MTTDSDDGTTADSPASATRPDTPTPPGTVLGAAGARIRHDPILVAPFAVVGLLVALADWLRGRDPIPVATPDSFGRTLAVEYSIFPRGTARTVRRVDALFGLRDPYLLGAVALELLVLLAVGIAGWLTIARALGAERRLDSLARYLGLLSVVAVLPRLLGSPTIDVGGLLPGALVLLVAALALVRLFLLPGFLAAGCRFATALRKSVRESRGRRWSLFWLIVVFGVASWGLAQVPVAGGFLSTAAVALVHAVSLAVLIGRNDDEVPTATAGLRGS